MEVSEVRDRGYEMGEELDGDELGAEDTVGSPVDGGVDEDGGQFTIEDSDDEDEGGDISGAGAGDEGARAFKAVVGNPPKSNSKETSTEIQDPLQSANDAPEPEEKEDKEETIPCLIDRLFSCTIDLLFCAGFTVPESVKGLDGDKINVSLVSISFCPSCSCASTTYLLLICSLCPTTDRTDQESC
jgi:hypothetical protein